MGYKARKVLDVYLYYPTQNVPHSAKNRLESTAERVF